MDKNLIKKELVKKLKQIQKTAKATGMSGTVNLSFRSDEWMPETPLMLASKEWDAILRSITTIPHRDHFFSVTDSLTITVTLD